MRPLLLIALLAPLLLASCGDSKKTVVVNPAPGQTVVVPDDGDVQVCDAGEDC